MAWRWRYGAFGASTPEYLSDCSGSAFPLPEVDQTRSDPRSLSQSVAKGGRAQ